MTILDEMKEIAYKWLALDTELNNKKQKLTVEEYDEFSLWFLTLIQNRKLDIKTNI